MTPLRCRPLRHIVLTAYTLIPLLTTAGARRGGHHGKNGKKLLHFLKARRSILNFPAQFPGNPLWQLPVDPYSLPRQEGFHQRLFGATIPFPSEVMDSLIRRQSLPGVMGQPMMQGHLPIPPQFQQPNISPNYAMQPFIGQGIMFGQQPPLAQGNFPPVPSYSQSQPYSQPYQFGPQTYMGQMPFSQGQTPPNQGQVPFTQGQTPLNQAQMQVGQSGGVDYSKYADLPPDQRQFMEKQDRETVERMTYQLQHPNTVQVVKRMVCLYGNLYYRPENVIYEVPAYRLICRLGADGNAFVELERKTNAGLSTS